MYGLFGIDFNVQRCITNLNMEKEHQILLDIRQKVNDKVNITTHLRCESAAAHGYVVQNGVVRINCVRSFYFLGRFLPNHPATDYLVDIVKPR